MLLRAWWLFCEYLFRLTQHLCRTRAPHHSAIFVGTDHLPIWLFLSNCSMCGCSAEYIGTFSASKWYHHLHTRRRWRAVLFDFKWTLPLPRYWFINVIQHARSLRCLRFACTAFINSRLCECCWAWFVYRSLHASCMCSRFYVRADFQSDQSSIRSLTQHWLRKYFRFCFFFEQIHLEYAYSFSIRMNRNNNRWKKKWINAVSIWASFFSSYKRRFMKRNWNEQKKKRAKNMN